MERRCPICERATSTSRCPEHRIPVIDPSVFSEVPVQPQVGTVIADRYVVQDVLGFGGMAAVYVAEDSGSGRRVALKFLRPARALDMRQIKRFYLEARALATIRHPAVIELLDFGFDEVTRMPYLSMQLVEGTTLTSEILRCPLTEARAAYVSANIAHALAAAHQGGFAHRDLKPDNVMITREGKVVVLDFGVAKSLRLDDTRITAPGAAVGTPEFMSPEQARGQDVDPRSDLYGLGCVLYAMLTARPPFVADTPRDVMMLQIGGPPPPLPELLAGGRPPSEPLKALYLALLAKRPEDRPLHAAGVAGVLEMLAVGDVVSARTLLARAMPASDDRARARAALLDQHTRHEGAGSGGLDTAVVPVDLDSPHDEPATSTQQPTVWSTRALLDPSASGSMTPAEPITAPALEPTQVPERKTRVLDPTEARAVQPRAPSRAPSAAPAQRPWKLALLVIASTGAGLVLAAVFTPRAPPVVAAAIEAEAPDAGLAPVAVVPAQPPVAVAPPEAPVETTTLAVAPVRPKPSSKPRATSAPQASPSASAAAAAGLVTLESEPSGAEVRAGARALGTTPLELRVEAPLELSLAKKGFSTRKVRLEPGEKRRTVTLMPLF